MALTISNNGGGGRILYITRTVNPLLRHVIFFPTSTSTSPTQAPTPTRLVVSAAKKLSSRTGRFDSKKRRSGGATTTEEQQERTSEPQERRLQIEDESVGNISKIENVGVSVDDGLVVPDLPGEKPDFWEGSQWDGFGFFMQYMWAFGIGFALIACGIAVVTYNEGATDFKETPAYKESVQSRELLEGPEASDSDVFESNPTEVAPSLD